MKTANDSEDKFENINLKIAALEQEVLTLKHRVTSLRSGLAAIYLLFIISLLVR